MISPAVLDLQFRASGPGSHSKSNTLYSHCLGGRFASPFLPRLSNIYSAWRHSIMEQMSLTSILAPQRLTNLDPSRGVARLPSCLRQTSLVIGCEQLPVRLLCSGSVAFHDVRLVRTLQRSRLSETSCKAKRCVEKTRIDAPHRGA